MVQQTKYLTPQEVVDRYGGRITVRTLANWRCAGTSPPYTKIGGRVMYPIDQLLEWEKRRTFEHTSNYRSS